MLEIENYKREEIKGLKELDVSLNGLQVRPVIFNRFWSYGKFTPTREGWESGFMKQAESCIKDFLDEGRKLAIVSNEGHTIPRKILSESKWLGFTVVKNVVDERPIWSGRITDIVKAPLDEERRKILPILQFEDITNIGWSPPDPQRYCITMPDLAHMGQHESVEIWVQG